MAGKPKVALSWAAACGGCDVSILDTDEVFLDVAELIEIVYWPVAMDFKREHLQALGENEVDIGLYNGAVRTAEHEEDAHLLREKCKVLVAFGACACFGGIPGLANITDRAGVFQTVYRDTPSTDNPDGITPETSCNVGGFELELPALQESVRPLHHVVEVDYFLPGCPPTLERVLDLVGVIKAFAEGSALPPAGTFLASDKGLCFECPRQETRGTSPPEKFVRPHEIAVDSHRCLIDQGLVCMGIATRGGCGAKCIQVNTPCRGCSGPLPGQLDPAAEMVSAIATIPGPRGNWEMPVQKIVSPARGVKDPLGTFYRFSYPISPARGTVYDKKRGA